MSSTASQITSLTIIYSTVYSGADQIRHQTSASLAFVRGIHRWPVNSQHRGPVNVSIWWRHHVVAQSVVTSSPGRWTERVRHELMCVAFRNVSNARLFVIHFHLSNMKWNNECTFVTNCLCVLLSNTNLDVYFPLCKVNTKITLSWGQKPSVTLIHTSVAMYSSRARHW